MRIRVHLKDRPYDISIGRGLVKDCGVLLKRLGLGRDAVVITNKTVLHLYGASLKKTLSKSGMSVRFEIIPDSERAKSNAIASRVLNAISGLDVKKRIFILAFGGGVVGDLAGFVASVYKRGIPYVQIPTTLLAQVDSAIGGKVAIDLLRAKNLVGSFYQPKAVVSDVSLLGSLPRRELQSGLAEVIKYGVIKDAALFEFLEKNYNRILAHDNASLEFVVARSSRIKARVVERDEFDRKRIRVILNFGHTIGHAIEAAAGYSDRYSHGEAVALGMITASRISLRMGIAGPDVASRIASLVNNAGLPDRIKGLDTAKIFAAHLHDKKFTAGKNRLVLPVKIGKVRVVEGVPETYIKEAIRSMS